MVENENRKEIQKKLQTLFRFINKNNKNLVLPYTITLGDETCPSSPKINVTIQIDSV